MPASLLRACPVPGCGALVVRGRCPEHARKDEDARRARFAAADAVRPSSHERGYDRAWSRARAGFLAKHSLCAACERAGRISAAKEVDHVVPHRGSKALFWQRSNWQALCRPCHDAKTARGE